MKIIKQRYTSVVPVEQYWTTYDARDLYIDEIGGEYWVHEQPCRNKHSVDLSQATGPFPTLKSAKAALMVIAS